MNESTRWRKLTIKEESGREFTGQVFGSGGMVQGDWALTRTRHYIELANEGEPLPIYEPKPGHCKLVLHAGRDYDTVEVVDLRNATVEWANAQWNS